MSAAPPLPTLLAHALVAFTIELDNEFEHTMTLGAAHGRVWITSMVMWSDFMQFVIDDGVPLGELDGLARITNLNGLERWGYITVKPDPADTHVKPPRAAWLVRPTPAGREAQAAWRPLAGAIEHRWRDRIGEDAIANLRDSLLALVVRLDLELPPYLPVVKHDMACTLPALPPQAVTKPTASSDLSVLLSYVLLAFTIEFERDSDVSLPMCANALRVLGTEGLRVRDLPRLTGVSKEAIAMVVGFLSRRGFAVVERDPAEPRTKRVRLTAKGGRAQATYQQVLGVVEDRWRAQFGTDAIERLRADLQRVADAPLAPPNPGGWRASVPEPETLPHYPMVLHRGGFPDGS